MFGQFAEAVATRYSGTFATPALGTLPRVGYLEAWNEPNLSDYLTPQYTKKSTFAGDYYRGMVNAFSAGVGALGESERRGRRRRNRAVRRPGRRRALAAAALHPRLPLPRQRPEAPPQLQGRGRLRHPLPPPDHARTRTGLQRDQPRRRHAGRHEERLEGAQEGREEAHREGRVAPALGDRVLVGDQPARRPAGRVREEAREVGRGVPLLAVASRTSTRRSGSCSSTSPLGPTATPTSSRASSSRTAARSRRSPRSASRSSPTASPSRRATSGRSRR